MKTRVVRYWLEDQWYYKVEEYVQSNGDEEWIFFGGKAAKDFDAPKKGDWYWKWVGAPLPKDVALEVAHSRAAGNQEVVAEFGE